MQMRIGDDCSEVFSESRRALNASIAKYYVIHASNTDRGQRVASCSQLVGRSLFSAITFIISFTMASLSDETLRKV